MYINKSTCPHLLDSCHLLPFPEFTVNFVTNSTVLTDCRSTRVCDACFNFMKIIVLTYSQQLL